MNIFEWLITNFILGVYPLQTQEVYQRQKHKSAHFVLQVILEKKPTPPLKKIIYCYIEF